MPNARPEDLRQIAAGSSVRLHTLVLLRWVAVAGQFAALITAAYVLGVEVPLVESLLVIAASGAVNLLTSWRFARSYRPRERLVLAYLVFDTVQLSVLLALTGGLSNPFALLVIVPVAIAATALTDRATFVLGVLTIGMVTALALLKQPLTMLDGTQMRLPGLIGFGFWLAIVIGVVFLALYARRVSSEMRQMSEALLATQMALAREQKLTDLGGVVAATAHELGTPLATIKLASAELIDEIAARPELAHLTEDAELIRAQADRCRDILQSMGRAGKDDLHLRHAPLDAVLREAAEPHAARGKNIVFNFKSIGGDEDRMPLIRRSPELIHGLRNLIQNAVDFADATVWIEGTWSADTITLVISDDGPGYPPLLLGRIGEPFLPSNPDGHRQFKGMGLGLFIAKTLLERSGARLVFFNGSDPVFMPETCPERAGAVVWLVWPWDRLAADSETALGPNPSMMI